MPDGVERLKMEDLLGGERTSELSQRREQYPLVFYVSSRKLALPNSLKGRVMWKRSLFS